MELTGGSSPGNPRLQISLVATLLEERENLEEWWESILAQKRPPDEMVVVDGGSGDGTVAKLQILAEEATFPVRVEVLPASNIAEGRNLAIRLSSHPVIAVTDGGCVAHPGWLDALVRPMEDDDSVDLVAGLYLPMAGGWFQDLSACATIPLPFEIREERFMPSSRSLAFRREVWELVGGYPEWLDIGEDMYFNHAWKGIGISSAVAKEAYVYWRMREDLPSLLRQYFLYARGDGQAGMYAYRHLIRFATYGFLACLLRGKGGKRGGIAAMLGASLYAGKRWARIPFYMKERPPGQQIAAAAALPPLMLSIDAAKMAGYLNGLPGRRRR